MKAQIGVRLTPLNGFINLDLADQSRPVDPYKLDEYFDNNEIDEVFIVNDTLDYLPLQGRGQALSHWLTKLAHGAKITLIGNDLFEVARVIDNGQLDLPQANAIVYGVGRKSFVRPADNIAIVMNTGQFELYEFKYNAVKPFEYVVTLRRK